MNHRSLQEEYEQLRSQLDEAYRAPVWQSSRIDHLADALADVERQLVHSHASGEGWRREPAEPSPFQGAAMNPRHTTASLLPSRSRT